MLIQDMSFERGREILSMIGAVPSLQVTDFQASIHFYCSNLGFELQNATQTFMILKSGRVDLHLHKKVEACAMYCGLYVTNIYDHLPEHTTLKQLHGIGKLRLTESGILCFTMKDPDGNMLELIEMPTAG